MSVFARIWRNAVECNISSMALLFCYQTIPCIILGDLDVKSLPSSVSFLFVRFLPCLLFRPTFCGCDTRSVLSAPYWWSFEKNLLQLSCIIFWASIICNLPKISWNSPTMNVYVCRLKEGSRGIQRECINLRVILFRGTKVKKITPSRIFKCDESKDIFSTTRFHSHFPL